MNPANPLSGAAALRHAFGVYTLSPATRELRRGGQLVETTPKMFDLLLLLLEQRHRVVPHDELIERVWARSHVSAGVLPQMVRKLRLALDMPGQRNSWIKGVRGVGYRFVGRVESSAGTAAPAPSADAAGEGQAALQHTGAGERALYEQAREQIRLDDLSGLQQTVAWLRSQAQGGGTRRCLVWAELFESHLERLRGQGKTAWHHLRTAQLMMEGLDEPHLRSEFHSVRGLYFETFTSQAEALVEFETAWSLAQQAGDLRTLAGCAARLAYAFAGSRNATAFEQWTERSLQLAAECGPRSVYLRHSVAAAMGWQTLALHHARAGEAAETRQAWAKALRLNEAVLNDAGDLTERTRRIAAINRLDAQASLQPESRASVLQALQAYLADEGRPSGSAQLHGLMARHLCAWGDAASLEAAAEHCRQALALCVAHGLNDQRDGLLEQAADVATAQGEHLAANRLLRELLRWRAEQAARQAERVAAITAVRLETERVLALAEVERERSRLLSLENQVLRQRTALLERLSEPDVLTGLATPAQFERQFLAAWADASSRNLPLCLAWLVLDRPEGAPPPGDAALREVAQGLLEACRDGDIVARRPAPGGFAIVFHGVGLGPAQAACERLRMRLESLQPPRPVSLGLADVGALDEAAQAAALVQRALAQAQAAGGNRLAVLRGDVIKK